MRAIKIKNKERQKRSICKSQFLDNRPIWGSGEMNGTINPDQQYKVLLPRQLLNYLGGNGLSATSLLQANWEKQRSVSEILHTSK